MQAVETSKTGIGVKPGCDAVGLSRSWYYRHKAPPGEAKPSAAVASGSPRALKPEEKQQVLDCMRSERFMDQPPREIYATLLDEGRYLCSVRTMYRILGRENEVKERRNPLRHPVYAKPGLLATAPNEVWSWDITKLLGPVKWTYFYLYVILDLFSRYVVGWMVATRESATLAQRLIEETCRKQAVRPGQLTLHADRGSSMTSKPVALLLADLGVTKTHSRPHTSNDNPFSESQFKTLKYRPGFPGRFGSIEEARSFCQAFSPGTTRSTTTRALGCSPPLWCTMARRSRFRRPDSGSWRRLIEPIPNDSSAGLPSRSPFPGRSGSTRRR